MTAAEGADIRPFQAYAAGMDRQIITTVDAPGSPLYSQGVRVGSTVYVSGMVGMDTATGQLAGASIQDQTRQALRNCAAVLDAAGGTLGDATDGHRSPRTPG